MTSEEFVNFRKSMAQKRGEDEEILSLRKTAALLGASRDRVRSWSTTHNPPLYIALAIQTIERNLP